jgi:hypothetical protein
MSTGYAIAEETSYKVESDHRQMKKAKKPGFIKRWMLRAVKDAVDAERQQGSNLVGSAPDIISTKSHRIGRQEASIDQPERAIQFTVYTANGGRVVETRRYDRKTDRSTNGLYVITSDQDFGREIDKIISMESLRG